MTYAKPLPHVDNILWLRKLARPFPTTAGSILEIAEAWHFSTRTTSFLKLFPKDEVFENDDDFLTRCDEVEMLIREESKMPEEGLLSPQD